MPDSMEDAKLKEMLKLRRISFTTVLLISTSWAQLVSEAWQNAC